MIPGLNYDVANMTDCNSNPHSFLPAPHMVGKVGFTSRGPPGAPKGSKTSIWNFSALLTLPTPILWAVLPPHHFKSSGLAPLPRWVKPYFR